MSKLTDISVRPKPIEIQRVSHALCVFNEKTIAALRTHPELKNRIDHHEFLDTAKFIEIVLSWWNIMNNSEKGKAIKSMDDPQIEEIKKFGNMCKQMGGAIKGMVSSQQIHQNVLTIHAQL